MCYSPESSFGTFIFVLIICLYLWTKGNNIQKTLAIMLLFIALMQILEGFLWLNLKCTNINKLISSFIPILLYLQPLIVIGTIYMFDTGFLSPIIYKSLIAIWLLSLPLFINWIKNGFGKCTTVGPKGHLAWPFANSDDNSNVFVSGLYNILLAIGFITLKTEWYGFFYVIMAAIGHFVSRQMYGHSWSSIWCHFVNVLAIGALFI
jgi:hypothetical protein